MATNKDQLLQLIEFVQEISSQPGNEWFLDELLNKTLINNKDYFGQDDHSAGSFIKLQRQIFKNKAAEFYRGVKNQDLKNELVKDYVEMLWYRMVNVVDRYFLFLYYQAENMLNYYILTSDAFNKIATQSDKYKIAFNEKFVVACKDNFFKSNSPISLSKINSIWAKLVYWAIDSNNTTWLLKNKPMIDTLINSRNLTSHRNSQQSNETTFLITRNQIKNYKKGDEIYVSYPVHLLKLLRSTIQQKSE